MNRLLKCAIAILSCLLAAACGGGGSGNGQPQPNPSSINALAAKSGNVRISARAGSSDPGSSVSIATGGSGSGQASIDGSFAFDAQATGNSMTVQYSKNGSVLMTTIAVKQQAELVSLNHFSTGSGPNEMLFNAGNLYVANSLDNSVVKYSLSGIELASVLFPEFSSPSHLTADLDHLYCVSNGSNQLTRMSLADLSFNQIQDVFQLEDSNAVFIGPAAAAVHEDRMYVPRSQVLAFPEFGSGDPTTYGTGLFSVVDYRSAAPTSSDIECSGQNPQFIAVNKSRNELVVVCGGELNFDSDFTPYVSTDSVVEFFSLGSDPERLGSINMGEVGAGAIAISSDGATAYFGNSINGNLYKLDLANRSILRGQSNPIVLTTDFTYIGDVEFSSDGKLILASSFNTDELYIVEVATDTPGSGRYPDPIDLSQGADLLAGAAAVEIDDDGNAWVLNGLANSVNRVQLLP
ncbi:hypothetical protein KDL30_01515 [bacterium]|nr:hypothetical protein [bacterium]